MQKVPKPQNTHCWGWWPGSGGYNLHRQREMGEEGQDEGKGGMKEENVGPDEMPKRQQPLTIDVETVLVQGVGAQLGDAIGQPAQLPVQPLPVQPRAQRVRVVCADKAHSSGCPILLGPGEGQ